MAVFSSPKPIIFLDVDGVLNTSCLLLGDFEADDPTLFTRRDAPAGLDIDKDQLPLKRTLLRNLRWLVEEIDAHIVVTSTWRAYPGMLRFLTAAFEAEGIAAARIVGATPWQNAAGTLDGRGAEIRAWLASFPAYAGQPFVVLDDGHAESFAAAALTSRVVFTSMSADVDDHVQGLTTGHARRAWELLSAGAAIQTLGSATSPPLAGAAEHRGGDEHCGEC